MFNKKLMMAAGSDGSPAVSDARAFDQHHYADEEVAHLLGEPFLGFVIVYHQFLELFFTYLILNRC